MYGVDLQPTKGKCTASGRVADEGRVFVEVKFRAKCGGITSRIIGGEIWEKKFTNVNISRGYDS